MRHDGRHPDQLRPVEILPNYLDHPTGSCLIPLGRDPRFVRGDGRGWGAALAAR